mmetsp:Transcript_20039/g.55746  ORF Transcript_20039/g.55746 Transcript_20039/m.55746 type:complete len:209 (+) Transcript_20039:1909-2535(+)
MHYMQPSIPSSTRMSRKRMLDSQHRGNSLGSLERKPPMSPVAFFPKSSRNLDIAMGFLDGQLTACRLACPIGWRRSFRCSNRPGRPRRRRSSTQKEPGWVVHKVGWRLVGPALHYSHRRHCSAGTEKAVRIAPAVAAAVVASVAGTSGVGFVGRSRGCSGHRMAGKAAAAVASFHAVGAADAVACSRRNGYLRHHHLRRRHRLFTSLK